MVQENSKGIWIISESHPDYAEIEGGKGGNDTGASYGESVPQPRPTGRKRTQVLAEDLKQEMSAFLEVVEEAFDQTQAQTENKKAPMRLDEIQLSVEISGEGKVSLLGTGAKAGSKGAITLRFKRQA